MNSIISLLLYSFRKNIINVIIVCACLIFLSSYNVVFAKLIQIILYTLEHKLNTFSLFGFAFDIHYIIFLIPIWGQLSNVIARIYDYHYTIVVSNAKARVIKALFSNIMYQDINFFRRNSAGKNTNQIMDISKTVENLFDLITRNFLSKIIAIIMVICTIYFMKPILAYILISWMLFIVCLVIITSPKISKLSHNYAEKRTRVAASILDTILNIHTIKNFFTQKYEKRYIDFYNARMIESEKIMGLWQNIVRIIMWVSYDLCMLFFTYFVIYFYYIGELDIPALSAILFLTCDIAEDLNEMTQDFPDILAEVGILKQSREITQAPEIIDHEDVSEMLINNGEIRFSNVTFKYKDNKDNILNNLSITIPAKQKVALVGHSGSGKTTFINLINRTFDIKAGTITIDDQNIANVTQKSLNRNISFIPQDTILFNRSILENITYGSKEYSMDQVYNAAKKAHIHDIVMNMPEQYNTICGERGNKLSGGQKQRILIARAILRDNAILIIDEATSSLDQMTEKIIHQSLTELMSNKTTIVIAHKLYTIQSLDRILFFENGKIIEDGTHEELIKLKGKYYDMYKSAQI